MRILSAFEQFLDGNGDPLINGWVEFLESGTTSTQKTTYSDVDEITANANPLQLDSEGRTPDNFGTGVYRVNVYANDELATGPGLLIEQRDPVGGISSKSAFSDWVTSTIYDEGEIVTNSSGEYFRSRASGNQGNSPTSASTYWEQIDFNLIWDIYTSYAQYSRVLYEPNGLEYISLQNSNLNKNPVTETSWWEPENTNLENPETYDNSIDYSVNAKVTGSDGIEYECFIANGPSSSVVSPISDATGTWAFSNRGTPGSFLMLPYEPTATQLKQLRVLECNGGSVLDADYADILTFWGSKIYGNVDSTHFNLPDLRGEFPRFFDNGAGTDPNAATRTDRGDGTTGDEVGTLQDGQNEDHTHDLKTHNGTPGSSYGFLYYSSSLYTDTTGITTDNDGGDEARPINISIWGGVYY